MAKLLTDRGLAALKRGTWASDPAPRGAGQLQVRRLAGGDLGFYFRYTRPDGTSDRIPIGTDLGLLAARARADVLSKRYQSGERDLRAVLASEERERQRLAEAAKQAEADKATATLGVLLTAYADTLEGAGKSSARQVRLAMVRHVQEAWPVLWATPVADVTTDDLVDIVGRVADMKGKDGKPKLREAAKLRSYLRAAFALAVRAKNSPQALPALRELRVRHNIAADVLPVIGNSKPRKRALTIAELQAYWRRVLTLPGAPGAALRFHVLTGGQRVQQLARLTASDLDVDSQTVRLLDTKGRRQQAREHYVPLIKPAQEALAEMRGDEPKGAHLFTLTQGFSAITYESLRDWVVIVREEMLKAGELPGGMFTVGDIRRTVETRLAGAGIGKEHRGQLQSHGLGGVQDRHYDMHNYLNEKVAALEALHRMLTATAEKVTPISKGRKRSA